MPQLIFLLSLACSLFMSGVIWIVQVVHYPLFARVGPAYFMQYEQAHTRLISWVVMPAMLLELATAVLLVFWRPVWFSRSLSLLALALVLGVWAVTFFVSVPQHARLSEGFDAPAHALLVSSNWWRTLGWSLRSLLLLAVVWPVLKP
ncbi:MAG: hypothetical protein IGS03_19290 [Candidatus Sericytochromatia bacterium]|nr:hypothetical protein [Candidatus Sericytochromatia bacterium]